MVIRIPKQYQHKDIRFYILDDKGNPVHPAHHLIEAFHNKQKDGSWLHKETNIPFKIKGKIYKGDIGTYKHDDKKFLEFLKTQTDIDRLGIQVIANAQLADELGFKKSKYLQRTTQLSLMDNTTVDVVIATDVKHLPIRDAEYIIEDLIPEGGVNFIAGKSGTYKSITSIHFAHCVATGTKLFNRYKVKKQKVLYVNEENQWPIFKPMVRMVQKGMKMTEFPDLFFCTFQEMSLDMNNLDGRAKLEKVLIETGVKVVFFDSLKRFINFEENDANKVNEWYSFIIKPLMKKYGITPIFIHHTRKEVAGKFRVDKKDLLRGSSDFVNIADNILYYEKYSASLMFKMFQLKNRIAEEFETKTIKIMADPNSGFGFEELTSVVEDSKKIELNICKKAILDEIFNTKVDVFSTGQEYRKPFLEKHNIKSSTFYAALSDLVIEGILEKGKRSTYDVVKDHITLKDMSDAQDKKELQLELTEDKDDSRD